MGVPWRVLEDLAAFNEALSSRFKFKTLALFVTDRETEAASRFVRSQFDFIDDLTGPEVLAVTLAEPRGGYWRYLREEKSDDGIPGNSIHAMLQTANREASRKADISRESLDYRQGDAAPTAEVLSSVLGRLELHLRPPFIILFDIPQEDRNVWTAEAYAAIELRDAVFADVDSTKRSLTELFKRIYNLHGESRGRRLSDIHQRELVERHFVDVTGPLFRRRPPPMLGRLAFGYFVAIFNSPSDRDVKVLVTIHGINTRGEWQKAMTPWIAAEGWLPYPVDYGRYWVTRFILTRHAPRHLQTLFRDKIEDIKTDGRYKKFRDSISVVAHSFGTQVVTEAFETYQHLMSFEKFIFCGSVVRCDYDWGQHFAAGRLRGLLNEFGTRDICTRVSSWVRRCDAAGAVGFSDPHVENQKRHVTHSDWFNRLQFDRVWVPFLRR